MIVKRGPCRSTQSAWLDLPTRSREHFTVLVPRVIPGTKEGTRTLRIRVSEFGEIRGCPRNCERRALGPIRPLGNWEGRTDRAMTREPGDLPAQSPNRWTGCPYGAVFRSGDGNAGAKAVRAKSPTTFRTRSPSFGGSVCPSHRVRSSPMRSPSCERKRRNVSHGTYITPPLCRAGAYDFFCKQCTRTKQCDSLAANRCVLEPNWYDGHCRRIDKRHHLAGH